MNKTNLNKYPLYEEEEIPIILTKYLVIIVFGLVLSWFSYFKHFSIILVNFKDFLISCTELSSRITFFSCISGDEMKFVFDLLLDNRTILYAFSLQLK